VGQLIRPRDTGVHLTELVQIGLRLSGPLGGLAGYHKGHRTSGRPLGAHVRRALRFRGLSRVGAGLGLRRRPQYIGLTGVEAAAGVNAVAVHTAAAWSAGRWWLKMASKAWRRFWTR
jgi:hypothetical protein